MGENKEVQEQAHEHDAQKGEAGDSGRSTAEAGHDARTHMQEEADKGDKFSENLTKGWSRDRSEK